MSARAIAASVIAIGFIVLYLVIPSGDPPPNQPSIPGRGPVGFEGGTIDYVTPTPGGIRIRP